MIEILLPRFDLYRCIFKENEYKLYFTSNFIFSYDVVSDIMNTIKYNIEEEFYHLI